jgi:hypothetical protein
MSVRSMSYESDEKVRGGIRGNIRIVDTEVQGLEWLYCSSQLDGIHAEGIEYQLTFCACLQERR